MQQNDCNILSSCHLSLPIPGCDRLSPYPYHDQFALFPCHTLVTASFGSSVWRCARSRSLRHGSDQFRQSRGAALEGLSPRSILHLDDSPTVLWDEAVRSTN